MSAHARAPLVPGIRALRILWRMLAPLAVCAVLLACTWLLGADDSLKQQALVLAAVILGFTLLVAVIHELLSPNRPRLRVIPMANHRAERLRVIIRGLLFILLGTELAIYLVRANGWSDSVATLLALLRTVGLILFAWAAISRSGLLQRLTPESGETYRGLFMRVLLRVVFPLAVLTLLFYVICSALGYVSLAGWAVRNAAWSAGVVLVGVLLLRYLRRRLRGAVNFMRDERTAGEEDVAPAYIGMERVLGGAAKLVIVGGAVLLILSIWGIRLDDAGGILGQPVVAGGEHTWGMFFFGLLKVALVVIAGAFVKNVLIFFVFPKADVELGARYAILTVLRYTVVVFGVLFAFASVGVGTSTLAVFAGGATVGLAFGMKDIFSNFFSGMIMLLERPVRVGDSVAVAGVEGKIEAIRLRGTTIRTFDGTTVIIPNTQMIGERLTSLSYGLHTARMQVDVGVSYDADPHEVERVLLDVARADERVLEDPAPFVRFNAFGASSLDFLMRCYTHEVGDRFSIASQLKVAVFEALKKNGIEIPFPQQDVHFRTGVQVEGTPSPERNPPSV